MPTLDDAPTVPKLTSASIAVDDLVQVYDTSAQRVKTITLSELAAKIATINEVT